MFFFFFFNNFTDISQFLPEILKTTQNVFKIFLQKVKSFCENLG